MGVVRRRTLERRVLMLSSEAELFLVKSLGMYAVLRGWANENEIDRRVAEIAGEDPGKRFKQARPSAANAEKWLPHYRQAILEVFDARETPADPLVARQLAALRAHVGVETEDQEDTIAFFLDEFGIEAHVYPERDRRTNLNGTKQRVLAQYGGLWRLYRLSRRIQAPGDILINRSLLSIHMARRNVSSPQGMPWFRLYFEGQTEGKVAPRRAVGPVFPIGERLIFLGHRISKDHPWLATMVWSYSDPDDSHIGHLQDGSGLAFLSNSQAEQIAAYVVAKFVPDTHAMDEASLRALVERDRPGIRTYRPQELGEELSEREIGDLVAKSGRLVFSNREA